MRVTLFTNTYLPHVGGVARSVDFFTHAIRSLGHRCSIVAPEFPGLTEEEPDVLRVPAIRNFNGSGFSVRLPVPRQIELFIEQMQPQIIHSQHPFLLGDAAVRAARTHQLPVVFTHHTLYERYTHYVPFNSEGLRRLVIQLATEYANLCDAVVAPSESIAALLRERGVESRIDVIPTGIDTALYRNGRPDEARVRLGIPRDARVVGHVGRLAEEKNLGFLADAAARVLQQDPSAWLLLVGEGPELPVIKATLESAGVASRCCIPGRLEGSGLADAYAAMDVFLFSSLSETQGLVIAEALASGTPPVALDGPGVRDVVQNGENGTLLPAESSPEDLATAAMQLLGDEHARRSFAVGARQTARALDMNVCAERLLCLYEECIAGHECESTAINPWERLLGKVEAEWALLAEKAAAAAAFIKAGAEAAAAEEVME